MSSAADEAEAGGELTAAVLHEAAAWHVLLHSGEVEEDELRGFGQWQQDSVHAKAYAELDKVWQQFDAVVPWLHDLTASRVSLLRNNGSLLVAISPHQCGVRCFLI